VFENGINQSHGKINILNDADIVPSAFCPGQQALAYPGYTKGYSPQNKYFVITRMMHQKIIQ